MTKEKIERKRKPYQFYAEDKYKHMIRLIKEETGLSYSYIGEAVIALGYREYISGNTHFLRPEVKDTDLAN
ncbi:MAG: hypothetical protein OXB92_17420 [Acidimicrobiaceae bacterium]|nr:hypothetical protein [Acidimicrobiaceae bacterium]